MHSVYAVAVFSNLSCRFSAPSVRRWDVGAAVSQPAPQITVLTADSTPCVMSQFPWKPNLYNRNPLGDDSCVTGERVAWLNCILNTVLWFIYVFFNSAQLGSYWITDRWLTSDMLRGGGIISRGVSVSQNVRLPEEWLTIFALDNIQRYSRGSQSQLCATSQRPVPVTIAPDKREAPYYPAFRQYISPVCLWVPFQKPQLYLELTRCLQLTNN